MDTVAEVVVRFAGALLAVARVGPGEVFRAGTAPGVELPLRVATAFPLVAGTPGGYVVRRPAGVTATIDRRPMPLATTEVRLGPDTVVELAIGAVTITVRRVARAVPPVPRPTIEYRPYGYAAAALLAHLAVYALAIAYAAPPRPPVARPPRPRLAHVTHAPSAPPQPPPPQPPLPPDDPRRAQPASPPAAAPATAGRPTSRRGKAIATARHAGVLGAEGLADLSSLVPTTDLGRALADATFYDEDQATQQGFGGTTRWDPGGTIPTGAYETISDGHGAGDDYLLPGEIRPERHDPVLIACSAASACRADGPIDTATIRATIDAHARALLGCYARLAGDAPGVNAVLAFEIDRDGAVLRASGRGPAEITACLVGVLETIEFPIAPAQTTVSLPLAIRRP